MHDTQGNPSTTDGRTGTHVLYLPCKHLSWASRVPAERRARRGRWLSAKLIAISDLTAGPIYIHLSSSVSSKERYKTTTLFYHPRFRARHLSAPGRLDLCSCAVAAAAAAAVTVTVTAASVGRLVGTARPLCFHGSRPPDKNKRVVACLALSLSRSLALSLSLFLSLQH